MSDLVLPPHFPDPNADPIAVMEAIIAQKDEIIAAQYREMKGWQAQLEMALMQLQVLEMSVSRSRAEGDY